MSASPEATMAQALQGRTFGANGNGGAKHRPADLLAEVSFTPFERKIYDKLALHFGKWVGDEALVASVYADDPNGGPDNPENSIAVTISRTRNRLDGTSLALEGAREAGVNSVGYRLVWKDGLAPAVAAPPAPPAAQHQAPASRMPRALRDGEIELGRAGNGDVLGLNLSKVIEGRLLVQANSGAGKSWLLRRLFEQAFGQVQQVMIDPDGEYATLAEVFDVAVLGAAEILRVGGRALALHVREHRYSAVLDLSDASDEDRTALVADFADGLVNAPPAHWHPCLVLCDEVQTVVPRYDPGDVEPETRKRAIRALAELMGRGRKRGLGGILATQRIAETSTPVVSKATNVVVGRTIFDRDLERGGKSLGYTVGAAHALSKLADGEFVCIGPALAGPARVRFRSGPITSRHKGEAPRVTAPPAITAAAAAAMLGQLPSADTSIAVTANDKRGWAAREDKILTAGYRQKLSIAEIREKLDAAGFRRRSNSGISQRAHTLGLQSAKAARGWTDEEDEIIRDGYAGEVRIMDIVEKLTKTGYKRGRVAVQMRAIALGVTRDRVNYWSEPEKEIAIRGLTNGTPYREIVAELRAAGYERGMTAIYKFAQKHNFNRAADPWTPKEIEMLRQMYEKKVPPREIAQKLGKTIQTVRTRASNLGLKQRVAWSEEEYELLAKCHRQGMTLVGAAQSIGRPYPNVATIAHRLQLDFRTAASALRAKAKPGRSKAHKRKRARARGPGIRST